mmetsp:Transcript_72707/g.229046  ORF Transcript_72707/g.229046 Transcript_72707/m.229046 type:complete len:367 (-) Transcript_72707:13-1113(-)
MPQSPHCLPHCADMRGSVSALLLLSVLAVASVDLFVSAGATSADSVSEELGFAAPGRGEAVVRTHAAPDMGHQENLQGRFRDSIVIELAAPDGAPPDNRTGACLSAGKACESLLAAGECGSPGTQFSPLEEARPGRRLESVKCPGHCLDASESGAGAQDGARLLEEGDGIGVQGRGIPLTISLSPCGSLENSESQLYYLDKRGVRPASSSPQDTGEGPAPPPVFGGVATLRGSGPTALLRLVPRWRYPGGGASLPIDPKEGWEPAYKFRVEPVAAAPARAAQPGGGEIHRRMAASYWSGSGMSSWVETVNGGGSSISNDRSCTQNRFISALATKHKEPLLLLDRKGIGRVAFRCQDSSWCACDPNP